MHIGQLLGSGRTADVYALGDSWVLRRYRDNTDATPELAVMSYLSANGFPVPRIGPPAETSLPSDLVLQRLTGPSLAEALLAGTLSPAEGGELLARLLRELHTIPPRLSQDADDRIVHLDLHPANVILTRQGPMVIDWRNASEGPPGLDRAMSSLILAQAVFDPLLAENGLPQSGLVENGLAKELLRAVLARLTDDGGVPDGDLALATARRAADPQLTGRETASLDEAARLVATLAGRSG